MIAANARRVHTRAMGEEKVHLGCNGATHGWPQDPASGGMTISLADLDQNVAGAYPE